MNDIKNHAIYKKFIENKGIIQPIKAHVINGNGKTLTQILKMIADSSKCNIQTVGFFATDKCFTDADERMSIGMSMVHPDDFSTDVDINISKIRAIATSYNKKAILGGMLCKHRVMVAKYSPTIYVFDNTVKQQFDDFVVRCKHYFVK